ncbi:MULTISPECIES: bifunctional UDP-N-acetylmuramoyl-tripeptide:D-alanyl-D-alanine ligase/alanine racemase [Sphingobacterium]|uniref:Alanine racemase n=1 Tax=Sphingobacterium tenebrionis TaxID=3111775 RepID=A0ABU8I6A7_9SPHI|nr:bifunctional UDP-N-acetylmuramoyl-tripeptide:D-alanyl-D-alanine ligase/alanine racemase [Sphingobacterium sp. CZ-2]QBR11381.1 bifunctional UDP-N-acetylmuramoyl-tripeptide:D-alanyl-D-alanine ligase/alanine racemase [Sphingobacterium sp. CZ-2]
MYSIGKVNEIVGGMAIRIPNSDQQISELVYDSRKISLPEESLFFALSATRDGHEFIADAYNQGIRSFIISKDVPFLMDKTDVNVLKVHDTLKALQDLAAYHRKQFHFPIIGITGSNGKSIVKAWLTQMLSIDKKVYQSPKSYNSQIGVALSLWNLQGHYDLAIIEAGISEPGEMDALAAMIKPDIGVFTNLGIAHAQHFKSKEEKLAEKLKLFKESNLLIAGSSYVPKEMVENKPLFSWGYLEQDDLQLLEQQQVGQETQLDIQYKGSIHQLKIPFTDKASIENVVSCVAIMLNLQYDIANIQQRVYGLKPLEMRLQLKKGINNSSIIDDSYSNDLASLKISLDFLQQQNQYQKKSIILSEMDGLEENEKFQKKLSEILNGQSLKRLIWVGKDYDFLTALHIPEKLFYPTTASLLEDLHNISIEKESVLIKGARIFQFEKVVERLALRSHGTVLDINLNALTNNLMVYRSLIPPQVKLMTMVKAFSYGSGSFEVANLLQFAKVDYLTVAFADEGVELRSAGITLPIMVLSPDADTFSALIKHDLEPEVYSMSFLNDFIAFLKDQQIKSYKIHLKLDTGMHRLGFFPEEIPAVIDRLKSQDQVVVQSFFTHLVASGDPKQDEFTQYQIDTYSQSAKLLEDGLGYNFIRHVANTSGIVRWPEAHFDMVRLGIGLYGVDMDRKLENLEQVSTLRTTVTQLKELKAGETIGYDRKGVLHRDSKIATVKIGYADGYNRRFGQSVGKMQINGKLVPTVGSICMDMCMLDVTDIEVKEGDEVLVFPDLMQASKDIGTIPYELLVNISGRVKRVYYYE